MALKILKSKLLASHCPAALLSTQYTIPSLPTIEISRTTDFPESGLCIDALAKRLPSKRRWCRPESGWNLEWRILRSHEGIVSSGKVNWLIDGFCGERLPTIDLAHVDLP